VAAGVLASCGESSLLEQYDESGVDRDTRGRTVAKAKAAPVKEEQRTRAARTQARTVEASRATASAPAEAREEPDRTGSRPGAARAAAAPESASSCQADLTGDMEGSRSAPSYADLARACVQDSGNTLVLEASTAGALPARMPDRNTHTAIGFEVRRPGGTIYVSAEATDSGWSAYLTRGKGRQQLPAPTVSGRQLRLAVPVSALDGARQVTWRVESSWLRPTLTSTSYSFDDTSPARLDRR
jgi:hypothetical protein